MLNKKEKKEKKKKNSGQIQRQRPLICLSHFSSEICCMMCFKSPTSTQKKTPSQLKKVLVLENLLAGFF
jgi:hypothetical protein